MYSVCMYVCMYIYIYVVYKDVCVIIYTVCIYIYMMYTYLYTAHTYNLRIHIYSYLPSPPVMPLLIWICQKKCCRGTFRWCPRISAFKRCNTFRFRHCTQDFFWVSKGPKFRSWWTHNVSKWNVLVYFDVALGHLVVVVPLSHQSPWWPTPFRKENHVSIQIRPLYRKVMKSI